MARLARRALIGLALTAVLATAWAGGAGATRIRAGTISFGFMAEQSWLKGGTNLANFFDHSELGWGVKVRYRLRQGWVTGATFTQQFYGSSSDTSSFGTTSAVTVDKLRIVTAGLELGHVFGSNEHPGYALLGVGVWHPTVPTESGTQVANSEDRVYLSGTLGTEIFVRRAVTLDLSLRGMVHQAGVRSYPWMDTDSPNKLDHEIQMAVGVHFYVLD